MPIPAHHLNPLQQSTVHWKMYSFQQLRILLCLIIRLNPTHQPSTETKSREFTRTVYGYCNNSVTNWLPETSAHSTKRRRRYAWKRGVLSLPNQLSFESWIGLCETTTIQIPRRKPWSPRCLLLMQLRPKLKNTLQCLEQLNAINLETKTRAETLAINVEQIREPCQKSNSEHSSKKSKVTQNSKTKSRQRQIPSASQESPKNWGFWFLHRTLRTASA